MTSLCLRVLVIAAPMVAVLHVPAAAQSQSQAPASTSAPSLDVAQLGVSVDRIRRELEEPSTTPLLDELNRPRFRLTVQGEWFIGLPAWVGPEPVVPGWVQPNMVLPHFEYLRMTVPEDFRSGALYPMGGGTNVGAAWDGFQQAIRRRRARKTREEIAEELRRLDALTSPFRPQ